jgi:cytochrome c-type biogenesis protein CcmF
MVPMIIAMAIGPFMNWKRGDILPALGRLRFTFLFALVAGAAAWSVETDGPFMGVIGIALAAWLGAGVIAEIYERIHLFRAPLSESIRRLGRIPRSTWGMSFAHFGLALAIAGMAGAGGWKVESIQTMKPGETVNVGGYEYTFEGAHEGQGPNYTILFGKFTVRKDGEIFTVMEAEKRNYPVARMPTTEAAIHTTLMGDLYAVIGDAEGDEGAYVTRIYYNPLVVWMWIGCIVMMFGGTLSMTDRRHRVGVPHKRQHASATSDPVSSTS